MKTAGKVGATLGAGAVVATLAFLANQPAPANLGEYLRARNFTESLFVRVGGGTIRGTFHPEFPITDDQARYGYVRSQTIGNTVGEREALDACVMAELGFPAGYQPTLTDHNDARIVARPGGAAAWDVDPIHSAAVKCAGPVPPDPPICPVCPDCPEPPPCPPAPPACAAMPRDVQRLISNDARWPVEAQNKVRTWGRTCPEIEN